MPQVQLVKTMLEELHVGTVVVSDSDTAWLRDPTGFLAEHPTADWFISSDCLSHELEAAWQPVHLQPRCGHITGAWRIPCADACPPPPFPALPPCLPTDIHLPARPAGNHWGRALNTGVFVVRNTPPSLKLLGEWRDMLLDPARATAIVSCSVESSGRSRRQGVGTSILLLCLLLRLAAAAAPLYLPSTPQCVHSATLLPQTKTNVSLGITDQLALNLLLEEGLTQGE